MYSSLYINNNGNLTFGQSLGQYTPESLNQLDVPMIAPFWSDVDTRSGPTVTFGSGTVDGHDAFGVNWLNVGCFSENDSVTDTLQVLLIDRPDLGAGDWQIEYNYGPLTWDSGQASGGDGQCLNGTAARAGYTSGEGASCELPGSGVNGGLLDSDFITGLVNNGRDSGGVLGRYVFDVSGDEGEPDGCAAYFALGDSYSSGEGAGNYTEAGGNCDRSFNGWPRLLDDLYPTVPPITDETFIACQGDTIPDIENGSPNEPVSQVTALLNSVKQNGEPDLVTLTGGGNDLHFGDVLKACVAAGLGAKATLGIFSNGSAECLKEVAAQVIKMQTPAFLQELENYYEQVVDAAQGITPSLPWQQPTTSGAANVVVVGYPNLFAEPSEANAAIAESSCYLWMGSGALAILTAFWKGQQVLNNVLQQAADADGLRFVRLGDVLAGHELCSSDPWILPLNPFTVPHSGHPKFCGQLAIAIAVANTLGYLPGEGAPASVQGCAGTSSGDESRAAHHAGTKKLPGTGRVRSPSGAGTAGVTADARPAAGRPSAGRPASAPAITSALPEAGTGVAYAGFVLAGGGTGPYTYAVTSGSLPAGLSLDAATGDISGTPATAGSVTFTVTATDSGSPAQSAAEAETIDVISTGALAVTAAALPGATVGQAYDATLAASGGTPGYTWSVTSGSLPAGLSLDAATGEISGQPTAAGTAALTIKATDSSTPAGQTATGTVTVTVTPATAPLTTVSATLAGASVGDTYHQALISTGGTGPVSWSVTSGDLPTGLSLDSASGEVTGVATEAGTFAFTAQVQDGAGHTATERLSATIANGLPPSIDPANPPDGTQGTGYDQFLTADGGVAPYAWSVTSGSLPDGLSLDPASGEISGTPTAAGSFTFAVAAADSSAAGQTATENFTLTITAAPPPSAMSATDTVTGGIVADSYQASLIPANGAQPYTYAVTSGALPAGLSLDPNFGVISGTPTTAGTFSATITVTDSSTPTPQTVTDSVSITITTPGALAVSTASLPDGAVGASYAKPVVVTGGTGADTFAVTSGALPAGLTLDPASGIIYGTPATTGSSPFTVTATDSATPTADTATASLTLTIGAAAPVSIATSSVPDALQNVPYSQILAAAGGVAPYAWSVTSGSLPDGLNLDPSAGVISGTATGSGPSTFTVQATDSLTPDAQSGSASLTLTVDPAAQLSITTTDLPEATQNAEYDAALDANGGVSPYTWSVSSGSLPSGLFLDPDAGVISGTPTAAGIFSFTVQAADGSTPTPQVTSQAFTITVAAVPLVSQTISFTPAASGTAGETATLSATGGGSGNPVVFSVDASSASGVCSVSGTKGKTISYAVPGNCVIDANQAGDASYAAAPQVQRTITVTKAKSTTVLSLSSSSVAYRHEKTLVFTVTISPQFSGTPTGTVTVLAGPTKLCKITRLSLGKGTCSPGSNQALPVGTHPVSASYSGNAEFDSSKSKVKNVKITKAKSKSALAPARTPAANRHLIRALTATISRDQ